MYRHITTAAVRSGRAKRQHVGVILQRYVSLLNGPRTGTHWVHVSERDKAQAKNEAAWRTGRMKGRFRNAPMNGNWRRKVRITGKKSLEAGDGAGKEGRTVTRLPKERTHPKRLRKPNISTNTPMVGHLRKTRRMPPRKQAVPRSLFFRAKK
jgi:hypothetical protein